MLLKLHPSAAATLLVVLTAIILASAPAAEAQSFSAHGTMETTGTSFHRFVRPGEAAVRVLVVGNGTSAGMYEVGAGTTLEELLILSSSPAMSVRAKDQKRVDIKLYRTNASARELVFDSTLEEVLKGSAAYPQLTDGDVFSVDAPVQQPGQRITWASVGRAAYSIGTIVLLVERIVGMSR